MRLRIDAKKLTLFRLKKAFTIKGLSLASGVSSNTISRLEKGLANHTRERTIRSLAAALEVEVEELVDTTAVG